MRFSILKNLVLINLMYANPRYTTNKRNKLKNKKSIQNSLRNGYILQQLFVLVFLNAFFLLVDFSKTAANYKLSIIFTFIFTLLIIVPPFLNMFYEDKDTPSLLVLPIKQKEIFMSKIITLVLMISGNITSIFLINIKGVLEFQGFNIISILLIVVFSLALLVLYFNTFVIVLASVAKTNIFKKYKTVFTTVITVLTMILSFAIYFLASPKNKASIYIVTAENYSGDFFFNVASKTLSSESLITIAVIIVLAILSTFLLNKLIINSYFQDIITTKEITIEKNNNKRIANDLNMKKIFRKITLKSFSDSTLITNNIVLPITILMVSVGYSIHIRGSEYFYAGTRVAPMMIIIGLLLGFIFYSSGSFSGVAISVDYKNYEFLKTLPINMRQYVLNKLLLSSLLQIAIGTVIFVIFMIMLKPAFNFASVTFIIFLLCSWVTSLHYFTKDILNPFIGFSNYQQLLLRGQKSQFLKGLLAFVLFIVIIAIIGGTFAFTYFFPRLWWLLSGFYILVLIIYATVVFLRFKNQVLKYL